MNTFLRIISGVLVFALLLWAYVVFTDKEDTAINAQLYNNSIIDSMKIEIEFLKADKRSVADSLLATEVEKCYVEIELNRAQAEVERLIKQHNKEKQKKDTPAIVRNCDSIINAIRFQYIPTVDTFRIISETVSYMQEKQLKISDSIEAKHVSLRNHLTNDLFNERTTNAILRSELNKPKKGKLFIGVGGFVAGLILGVFIK